MAFGLLTSAEIIGEVKDLSEDDLSRYENAPGKTVRDFKVARDKHHRIAQLFALGVKSGEIAARLEMTPSTISILRRSPSMEALVCQYREEAFSSDLGVSGMIEEVAIDGLRELHIRIMTGDLGDKELVNLTTGLFDRTGRGPTKKIERRDLRISGAELIELKAQAREAESFRPAVGQEVRDLSKTDAGSWDDRKGFDVREKDEQALDPALSLVPGPAESVD